MYAVDSVIQAWPFFIPHPRVQPSVFHDVGNGSAVGCIKHDSSTKKSYKDTVTVGAVQRACFYRLLFLQVLLYTPYRLHIVSQIAFSRTICTVSKWLHDLKTSLQSEAHNRWKYKYSTILYFSLGKKKKSISNNKENTSKNIQAHIYLYTGIIYNPRSVETRSSFVSLLVNTSDETSSSHGSII